MFCRVRPFLPGEGPDGGRESICSNGSRGSGKGSKVTSPSHAQLQIQYPDEGMDGKRIALQYSSEQVGTVVALCTMSCIISVLPGPFQHSGPPMPSITLFFFDVGTKMIDVVTNSAQTTPTH